MSILSVKNLTKHFGGLYAVKDLHFQVKPGTITGLIGPNGAGKTTAFNLITNFLPRDGGEVRYHDYPIRTHFPHRLVGRGIARTFQQIRLCKSLTVRENLLLANSKWYDQWWQSFRRTDESAQEKVIRDRLHRLNLGHIYDMPAGDLSYGQSKLVEILRAILTDAELLLLDEPAAGVNPTLLETIKELIRELKTQGKTLFIIEHNMPFLMEISDEIIVMENGEFLVQDVPKKIQKNPEVLRAYLGHH